MNTKLISFLICGVLAVSTYLPIQPANEQGKEHPNINQTEIERPEPWNGDITGYGLERPDGWE